MEWRPFRPLPQVPEETPEDMPSVTKTSPVHQAGHQQRGHMTPPNETHEDVQQPRISARVSQKQFQDSVFVLCRNVDAQTDSTRQRTAVKLKRRTAVRYLGTPPRCRQQFDGNNRSGQISAGGIGLESTVSGSMSVGVSQKSGGQSYVEKQREEQQVHTKTHPGDISSLLRGGADSDEPSRRRNHIRQLLSRRRQHKAAPVHTPRFDFQDRKRLQPPPNWPFGCKATSIRHRDSNRGQLSPLTQREIRLLLRNPLIRDGNMGPLPAPAWATPPRPPPHTFGIAPGPEKTGRALTRLPGLKRRNAQRRSPNPQLQNKFEAYNNRFNARFRRGSAARDVHVVYSSPVELARRKSILPQIQEADHESSDSESIRSEGGETGTCQEDQNPHHASPARDEQDTSSQEQPQHQSHSNEPPSTNAHTIATPRRFPLVGPRSAPASLSASSSAPSTPPSTAPLTAVTQASTPPSELELDPKGELSTQNGTGCGMPGCKWADCSRIRGTFRMPAPGAEGGSKPEASDRRGAETTSTDDVVSVGNGFSFLRLN